MSFRRPSGGSLQGERMYSSGRRTPTGRLTPTQSGNSTPVNLLSSDTSKPPSFVSLQQTIEGSEIVVPEIPVSFRSVISQFEATLSKFASDFRFSSFSSYLPFILLLVLFYVFLCACCGHRLKSITCYVTGLE